MFRKETRKQPKCATLETAPQSGLTSASAGQSSATVVQRGRKKSSTSTSYVISQENEENEDPLGADEGIPDVGIPPNTTNTDSNITRCCPKNILGLDKALDERDVAMINDRGCGAPLMLQVTDTLQPSTVRNVAALIDEKGMLALKGLTLSLYELAPCVIGDPNEGDYVRPSLGIPVDHDELIEKLKSVEDKKRNITLLNLRSMLIAMSKTDDKKDNDYFMCLFMVLVMGVVNAPNTTDRANLNYLGTFLTGKEYMLCDHIVDTLVHGVTNWRKKKETATNGRQNTIPGNMLLPIIIVADFAKLDGDDVDPPVPGYPRYAHITQERLTRLFEANWEELEFRTFDDSVYAEPYTPPSRRDVLGAGSSHGSSPQPTVINLDGHYFHAAKATELMSKLRSADTVFLDSFLKFMTTVVHTLEGNAKEDARHLMGEICSMGKTIAPNTGTYISVVLEYISANKAMFERFDDELNKYVSAIKALKREMTGKAEECDCCFEYPSVNGDLEISCKDLKCLEDGRFLSNNIIELYILHLQGRLILPELKNSEIHNKYFIMHPLYYDNMNIPGTTIGKLEKQAARLKDKPYLLWPVNGGTNHWSLAIMCKEDNQRASIIHMDSYKMHDSEEIFRTLARYMKDVLHIDGVINTDVIEVPRQENGYDCGIFMLYSMKKFIEEYTDNMQFGKKWYRPEVASALRTSIKDLIQENKMKGFGHGNCSYAKKWGSCLINQTDVEK